MNYFRKTWRTLTIRNAEDALQAAQVDVDRIFKKAKARGKVKKNEAQEMWNVAGEHAKTILQHYVDQGSQDFTQATLQWFHEEKKLNVPQCKTKKSVFNVQQFGDGMDRFLQARQEKKEKEQKKNDEIHDHWKNNRFLEALKSSIK